MRSSIAIAFGLAMVLAVAASGAEPGPGRLVQKRGSSTVWFIDSFGTRHRIASAEVLARWWSGGPAVDSIPSPELDTYPVGDEIDPSANPFKYVVSRDQKILEQRLRSSQALEALRGVFQSSAPSGSTSATPQAPSAMPSAKASAAAPGTDAETNEDDGEATPSSPAPPPPPEPAAMLVHSDPSGAAVYRSSDGSRLGKTPLTIHLPAGKIRISVVLKGFQKVRQTVTLHAGRTQTVSIPLHPIARPSPAGSASHAPRVLPPSARPTPGATAVPETIAASPVPSPESSPAPSPLPEQERPVQHVTDSNSVPAAPAARKGATAASAAAGAGTHMPARSGAARAALPTIGWAQLGEIGVALSDQGPSPGRSRVDTLEVPGPVQWILPGPAGDRLAALGDGFHFVVVRGLGPGGRPEAVELLLPKGMDPVSARWISDRDLVIVDAGGIRYVADTDRLVVRPAPHGLPFPAHDPGASTPARGRLAQDLLPTSAGGSGPVIDPTGTFVAGIAANSPHVLALRSAHGGDLAFLPALDDDLSTARLGFTGMDRIAVSLPGPPGRAFLVRVETLSRGLDVSSARGPSTTGTPRAGVAAVVAVSPRPSGAPHAGAAAMSASSPAAHVTSGPIPALPAVATAPSMVVASAANPPISTAQASSGVRDQGRGSPPIAVSARPAPVVPASPPTSHESVPETPDAVIAAVIAPHPEGPEASPGTPSAVSGAASSAPSPAPVVATSSASSLMPSALPSNVPSPASSVPAAIAPAQPPATTMASPAKGVPGFGAEAGMGPAGGPGGGGESPRSAPPMGATSVTAFTTSDLPMATGTTWTYTTRGASLIRTVSGSTVLQGEPAIIVRDRWIMDGVAADGGGKVMVLRPRGLYVAATARASGRDFEPLVPEELLLRLGPGADQPWITGSGQRRAVGLLSETTPAGLFRDVMLVRETARLHDPLDVALKLLTYENGYARGAGLISRTLVRRDGTRRPVLTLAAFHQGDGTGQDSASPGTVIGKGVRSSASDDARARADPQADFAPLPLSPSGASGRGVSDEDSMVQGRGDEHYTQAQDFLKRRMPMAARAQIESALAFDPQNADYLQLKRRILAAIVADPPYRPATFGLGQSLGEQYGRLGDPDIIDRQPSALQVGRHRIGYGLRLVFMGGPDGPAPVPDADDSGGRDPTRLYRTGAWEYYIANGTVVARQVVFKGNLEKAQLPLLDHHLAPDILALPHTDEEGALAHTRRLCWDLGWVRLVASAVALPQRRYDPEKGYLLEAVRDIHRYRVRTLIAYLDPEIQTAHR